MYSKQLFVQQQREKNAHEFYNITFFYKKKDYN